MTSPMYLTHLWATGPTGLEESMDVGTKQKDAFHQVKKELQSLTRLLQEKYMYTALELNFV